MKRKNVFLLLLLLLRLSALFMFNGYTAAQHRLMTYIFHECKQTECWNARKMRKMTTTTNLLFYFLQRNWLLLSSWNCGIASSASIKHAFLYWAFWFVFITTSIALAEHKNKNKKLQFLVQFCHDELLFGKKIKAKLCVTKTTEAGIFWLWGSFCFGVLSEKPRDSTKFSVYRWKNLIKHEQTDGIGNETVEE